MSPDRNNVEFDKPTAPTKVLLVVDDDVLIRLALSDFFRSEGYTVLEAASADEAQTILQSESGDVDLVMSDLSMPSGGEGVRLALWLSEQYPGLPVLFMSGEPTELAAAATSCDNSVGSIAKPFQYESALALVCEALSDRATK